jgi:hypothetical protein
MVSFTYPLGFSILLFSLRCKCLVYYTCSRTSCIVTGSLQEIHANTGDTSMPQSGLEPTTCPQVCSIRMMCRLEDKRWTISTTHLWRRRGERMYSSYSFMTSTLDGCEWSAPHSGRSLLPGKGPPVPIVQEARCAPEPVWTQRLEEKISCLFRGSNLDRQRNI